MEEHEDWNHCLGGDKLCTCPCGKGLRPDFSPLRDERGRQCQPCINAEAEQKEIERPTPVSAGGPTSRGAPCAGCRAPFTIPGLLARTSVKA